MRQISFLPHDIHFQTFGLARYLPHSISRRLRSFTKISSHAWICLPPYFFTCFFHLSGLGARRHSGFAGHQNHGMHTL